MCACGARRGDERPHPRRTRPARPFARSLHCVRSWNDGLCPMSNLMNTYKPTSMRFVAGSGAVLVDDGREYLHFLAGLAVVSLGPAHPAVAEAISPQASTLLHVSNLFSTGLNEE